MSFDYDNAREHLRDVGIDDEIPTNPVKRMSIFENTK